ncbi:MULTISPECIES: hypothetical protein [Methylobacterium]|uniref:Uncharacterized protein n=1 Tax=Methylobacterium bullatum TaxID=570505 RepID=A0AAV4Z3E1_9HYPH|nr:MULTISPECIES: hypothetical protein [Methylobacterium]KQO46065.1 hypothetical protein ASF08_06470 [Methylobacterium sp. Leaf85]MBD8904564.1 hypothetical protein [Methylobacterium bullatum]GJD38585.1 hypothetical protein OICFNHDK_1030 [Methylobacterium bullatum]
MLLLLTILWPALAASLALGTAIGWHFGPPRDRLSTAIGLGLGFGAMALAGLAFSGLVPGRPGFWVESAALNLAAYLVGAGTGALARLARPSPPRASGLDRVGRSPDRLAPSPRPTASAERRLRGKASG